jgi:hypothetical protein
MNLVAKIRSLQAQVDELRARLDAIAPSDGAMSIEEHQELRKQWMPTAADLSELAALQSTPLTAPIAVAEPIASATIAPPPAKRRGRPPKPKV